MAFSASWNYTESYTAANIIERSLKRLSEFDANETIDTDEQTDALVVLNLIVKGWNKKGAGIWLRKTGHLFLPDPGTVSKYTFGTSGTALFTSQYYTTTLASAASESDTAITVTDDTNMSNADRILVENDDGTLTDTTINGAPSANAVTLTAGLDDSASSGNAVYTWPTSADLSHKLVKLKFAQRRITDLDNAATDAGLMEGIDTPLSIIGEQEYLTYPTKLQTGVPVSVYLRQATTNPELHLWPTGGEGSVHSLVLDYTTHMQDLDATSNNLDIPADGVNPLAWWLAYELGPEYGIPEVQMRRLEKFAKESSEEFFDFLVENADVAFELGYN
jgi:hypothetical protein